jgi:hypothetical protein
MHVCRVSQIVIGFRVVMSPVRIVSFVSTSQGTAHLPSFLSSSLFIVSPSPISSTDTSSPQLNRKVVIRVIVVPALFPKMCVAVGNLCLLLSPVCRPISLMYLPPITSTYPLQESPQTRHPPLAVSPASSPAPVVARRSWSR